MTNPAEWDSSGLLHVRRRIDSTGPQHACTVGCSPNLCKGELDLVNQILRLSIFVGDELEAFLARHGEYDRIFYVGDGSNDFCPILRLRRSALNHRDPMHSVDSIISQDTILCRSFGGLHKRIAREGGMKCQVKYWTGAWEVEEIFNTL